MAQGMPEQIAAVEASHTGRVLAQFLAERSHPQQNEKRLVAMAS